MSTSKFELTKSIEARKLNPRTGIPTTEPPVSIPFGAVIDQVAQDRDDDKFLYLGLPYQCPHDILKAAVTPVRAARAEPAPAAASETPTESSSPPAPKLVWEALDSGDLRCQRAKVPGGWLVLAGGSALAFYPDPEHRWDGGSPA